MSLPVQRDWRSVAEAVAAGMLEALSKANSADAKAAAAATKADSASTAAASADTRASAAQSMATTAETTAAAAQSKANAAEQLAQLSRIDFGLLNVTFQAVAALSIGPQTITFDVPTAKQGDRVTIFPVTFPAGYAALGNGYSAAAGKVTMQVLRPPLSVLTNVTFTVRAIGYRDPA